MADYKILMTDCCFPDQSIEQEILSAAGMEMILSPGIGEDALIEAGKDCDGIIVDFAQLTDRVLSSLPRCRIIVRVGIGLDVVDMDSANKNGIMVANIPDYCLDEVADHTIALYLACSRQLLQYNSLVRKGEWDVSSPGPIYRPKQGVFGLFGLGNIAQKVALRAKSFGFSVFAYDPYLSPEIFERLSVKRAESLEQLAEISDVLSLHAPLTRDTAGIVNLNLLKKMKPTAILINTSRGPLIREADITEALKSKLILSAGLDVLEHEPPAPDCELVRLKNALVTPHVAFLSVESERQLRTSVAEEIVCALRDGQPKTFFNRETIAKR